VTVTVMIYQQPKERPNQANVLSQKASINVARHYPGVCQDNLQWKGVEWKWVLEVRQSGL